MKRNGLFSTVVALILAGSFGSGFFVPELQAQGGLPEIFSSLRPLGSSRELDPLATYNKTLQWVKDRFYGDLPTGPDGSEMELTYAALRGMLNTLDDPYTRFVDRVRYQEERVQIDGQFDGIGASLSPRPTPEGFVRVAKPVPGGPAEKAGLKRGDLITRVDGKSVVGMDVDEAVRIIRGKAGTVVRLTIQRSGAPKPLEIPIVRAPVEWPTLDYSMKEGGVGYVVLNQFNELADQKLEEAIRDLSGKGMKGLVLDLRGNPGGLLEVAIDIVSRFVPPDRGAVVIVEAGDRDVRKTNPRKYLGGKWPVVVLVNRTSASASEIVAGAIKDNHAGTVVGTTTFGKGLVQTVLPLQGGAACIITTAKYLTPSGRDINRTRGQRGGVDPDVAVDVTDEQFVRGEDPQLKKAIEILHEKIGYRPPAAATARNPNAGR